MGPFASGAPVTVSTSVRVAGVLTDPTGITLQVRYPDGTTMTGVPSPARDNTGLYHVDLSALSLSQLGRYRFAWVTTGTAAGVQSGGFDVIDAFAPVHISMDEVLEHLELTGKVLADTKVAELQRMLASAISEQERRVGAVAPRAVTEVISGRPAGYDYGTYGSSYGTYGSGYGHPGYILLGNQKPTEQLPVLSVISATLNGTSVDVSQWYVENGLAGKIRPSVSWPFGSSAAGFTFGTYAVVYTAGRNPVPADLQEAALLRVQASYDSQRGPAGMPLADQQDSGFGSSYPLLLRAQDKEKPYVLPSVA